MSLIQMGGTNRLICHCSKMPTYQKDKQIDEGGQGCVWSGIGPDFQPVALKYIKTDAGVEPSDEQLKRFEREVSCQSTLHHPGIMPILASDFKDAEPYFVMPLAEDSLLNVLKSYPSGLPEDQAVEIFRKILDAVVYAHSEKVLHRDLKPGNVLFWEGEPRLSDFGLGRRWDSLSTKLTMTNFGLGTVAYSAPEQLADGHSADERADIFALGRLLYEMLTGKIAFLGVDLDLIPGKYKYFIVTAMQSAADKRYASTLDMARQFEVITRTEAVASPGSKTVQELATLIDGGDLAVVKPLVQLLLENSDDPIVYLKEVPFLPVSVIEHLSKKETDAFRTIILAFDEFAAGQHPWSFVDTIGRFLRNAFLASDDIEVRRVIIVRLLLLAYSHNRFFVRDRLVEVVRSVQADPTYTPLLVDAFEKNKHAVPFSRLDLLKLTLPQPVRDAIRAGDIAVEPEPERALIFR